MTAVDSEVHVPLVTKGFRGWSRGLNFGVFQSIGSSHISLGQKLHGPIRGHDVIDKELNQSEADKLGGNRKCESEVRHQPVLRFKWTPLNKKQLFY